MADKLITKGLVHEVVFDSSAIDWDAYAQIKGNESIKSPESFPANSLIIRDLDTGGEPLMVRPFFSSHLSFPVKVGEIVWLINMGDEKYWLSRKIGNNSEIEDVSYSTDNRVDDPTEDGETIKAMTGVITPPDFPNPADEHYSEEEGGWSSFLESTVTNIHLQEPVPRFKKRPGDFVIQGSNNTLIVLGQERGWSKNDNLAIEEKSSAHKIPEEYSGTIDIVTGRGRFLPIAATTLIPGIAAERTAPLIIENTNKKLETDKAPEKHNSVTGLSENIFEGDPDFAYDASRIYISSKTSIDEKLAIDYPQMPQWGIWGLALSDIPMVSDSACIAIKSDEIRIVSRFIDTFGDEAAFLGKTDISDAIGSIRIVKEGKRDIAGHSDLGGQGQSVIIMQPDGTILIDGTSIIIGSGREGSNGLGDQVFIGTDATEPIVLGNQLAALLGELCDAIGAITVPTGVGPSGAPINAASFTGIKSKLDTIKSKIGMTK